MANENIRYFETQIALFHSTVMVEEGVVVAVLYCQPLGTCPSFNFFFLLSAARRPRDASRALFLKLGKVKDNASARSSLHCDAELFSSSPYAPTKLHLLIEDIREVLSPKKERNAPLRCHPCALRRPSRRRAASSVGPVHSQSTRTPRLSSTWTPLATSRRSCLRTTSRSSRCASTRRTLPAPSSTSSST